MRWVKLTKGEMVILRECCRKTEINQEEICNAYALIFRGQIPNLKAAALQVLRKLQLKLSSIQIKLERTSRLGRSAKGVFKLKEQDIEFCKFLLTQQGLKIPEK